MKKMVKYFVMLVTITAMMFSFSLTAQAEEDLDRIEVQSYFSYYSEKLADKYPQAQYAMVDLNGDDILEYFLLVPSGARQRILLYTYLDGKTELVKNFGASSNLEGYDPENGKFVISKADGYANTTFKVYKLKEKTLKRKYYYKSKLNYETNTVNYYKNKKQISQDDFIEAITNFGSWSQVKWETQPME